MCAVSHLLLHLLCTGTYGPLPSRQYGCAPSLWSIRQWAARWKEATHIFLDSTCSVFAQGSHEQFHRWSHAPLHWLKLPRRFSLQDHTGFAPLASSDSPLLFTQRAATLAKLAVHILLQILDLSTTMGNTHTVKGIIATTVGSTKGSMTKAITTEAVTVSKAISALVLEGVNPAAQSMLGYVPLI